ncbi:hypothetical protein [Desulfatiglans anilini]|uniref:hypothetical protein n=1 Tax=Desulfatiglans anilini TaxID=90728 RepID=UPI0004229BA7|nr:hypothetical protein [Desulfatiglans anilini]
MDTSSWEAWIDSPGCFAVLERCAATVSRKIKALNLSSRQWPYEDNRELAAEIWAFLKEKKECSLPPDLLRLLQDADWSRFAGYLGTLFLNHALDRLRTREMSPWHALYRRVRQALSNADGIHYKAGRGAAFYSWESGDERPVIPPIHDLSMDETDWAMDPADAVKQANLAALSKSFERLLVERTGIHGWVPVRSFVSFLGELFPALLESYREVPLPDGDAPGPGGPYLAPPSDPGPTAEEAAALAELAPLAQRFVKAIDDRKRAVLHLKYGMDLSLEEMARRLGYKGPSGPLYQLNLAEDALRGFCSLWPGLSPEDLDEHLFGEFVARVLELCKSAFEGRSDSMKEDETEPFDE